MRRHSRHCIEEYAMEPVGQVVPDPNPPPTPPPAQRDNVAIDMLEECYEGGRSRCEFVIRSECQPNQGNFLVQALKNLPGFRECLANDIHISMSFVLIILIMGVYFYIMQSFSLIRIALVRPLTHLITPSGAHLSAGVRSRPQKKKVFWTIVIVVLSAIVYVIVHMGQTRTMGHPLVINPETEETYIGNVAFPKVTIAPPGGFKRSKIHQAIRNSIDLAYEFDTFDNWTYNEAVGIIQIIDQVCSPNTTFAVMDNDLQKSKIAAPFIREGMVNCSELFERCFLNGMKLDCGEVFKEHFSERGSSCVFNGIPTAATRLNKTLQSEFGHQYKAEELTEWQKVKSDRDSDSVAEKGQNRTIPIPWKQYFPGKTAGLTFLIKRENDSEKACVHGEGDGLMLAVNHPFDEPQIQRFGAPIPFGVEAYVAVRPTVIFADDEIKDIDPKGRRCYFSDEGGRANLKYYEKYSKQNCLSECFSNEITTNCNCSMVTYPGIPGHRLCTVDDMKTCVHKKEQEIFKTGLTTLCSKCHPNCRDTKYEMSISWSPMTEKTMKDWDIPDNANFSLVHVYFATDSVQAMRRSSRYNWFEVTGLNGGTISMVTGLSLLDAIKGVVAGILVLAGQYFITSQQPDGSVEEETSDDQFSSKTRHHRSSSEEPPPPSQITYVQPRRNPPTPPPQYRPVEPEPDV
ncbi:Pickpocket protein 28 [Folsomia candida]|uniref:Pickpocket protein 28 n=1 Tax=Folsomia candida TaxID=158441 RepID=A0A226EE69_FOLCA|nr:Pickpocket protein 28 [Folsomia candida]